MSIEDTPKVSCVCLVNEQQWLDQAISGFKSQTYNNKELILVLACNAQPSGLPDNIQVITLDHVMTVGDAKNKAIQASSGEFIINWEQGCRFSDDRILIQMAAMAQNESPVCLLNSINYDVNNRHGILKNAAGVICETIAYMKHPELIYNSTNFGCELDLLNIISHLENWKVIVIPNNSMGDDPIYTRCC